MAKWRDRFGPLERPVKSWQQKEAPDSEG